MDQHAERDAVIQQVLLVLLALALLLPLGVIYVIEAVNGRPFTEPSGLITLAGVAIAFFFRNGSFLGAAAQTAAIQAEANRHTETILAATTTSSKSGIEASPSSATAGRSLAVAAAEVAPPPAPQGGMP